MRPESFVLPTRNRGGQTMAAPCGVDEDNPLHPPLDSAVSYVVVTLVEGYGGGGGAAPPPIGLISGNPSMELATESYPSWVKTTV